MTLTIKNIDFNTVKKLSLILGFDISEEEQKQKAKGRQVKEEAKLLTEIENEVKKKKPKKK